MGIDEQTQTIVDDVEVSRQLSGPEIIKNNIVELNTASRKERLEIAKVREELLTEIRKNMLKLDAEKQLKLYEKLSNIELAHGEKDNNLLSIGSKDSASIIFETADASKKDNINAFSDSLTSEQMNKIDSMMKLFDALKK